VIQFLGEAAAYSLMALVLAIALSELASPLAAGIVGRQIRPDYLHHPAMLLVMGGSALMVGLLAGFYPALVMASFRPASVLKGGPLKAGRGAGLRQGLAVVQFAILIGLLISALVIWRQTAFALAKGLDHGADRILLVSQHPDCLLLRDRVRRLPGVAGAACATAVALTGNSAPTEVTTAAGRTAELDMAPLDFGVMEMHGLRPWPAASCRRRTRSTGCCSPTPRRTSSRAW
jgi:putative ABC transport system permease protein